MIKKDVPKRAKARFLERMQTRELADAIRIVGSWRTSSLAVSLARSVRQHQGGSLADVTVTIDDNSRPWLRLLECGVQVDSH